jgi:hypothetical protein
MRIGGLNEPLELFKTLAPMIAETGSQPILGASVGLVNPAR